MHNWLKEYYPDFPAVDSKTVFNFICWVRQKYHLQKVVVQREYAMGAEGAYDAQAQADFGEYNLRNSQGRHHTRFTTELWILSHQQTFAFIEGILAKFRLYSSVAGFALHFLQKGDPESKGNIENAVKYVKQNFLYSLQKWIKPFLMLYQGTPFFEQPWPI